VSTPSDERVEGIAVDNSPRRIKVLRRLTLPDEEEEQEEEQEEAAPAPIAEAAEEESHTLPPVEPIDFSGTVKVALTAAAPTAERAPPTPEPPPAWLGIVEQGLPRPVAPDEPTPEAPRPWALAEEVAVMAAYEMYFQ